ncbi:MAG: CoA-binding protein, partial [Chloroflexota bacterium]
MPTRREIHDFLAQKRVAVVGVSRDSRQFANGVYRALKKKGYQLYPVNPNAQQ